MPAKITITTEDTHLRVEFTAEGMELPGRTLFVALDAGQPGGCAVIPYAHRAEGSTVFLPFRADRLYAVRIGDDGKPGLWRRQWIKTQWSRPMEVKGEFKVEVKAGKVCMLIKDSSVPLLAVWAKDLTQNDGWGFTLGTDTNQPGFGDISIRRARTPKGTLIEKVRPRIYQLLPRLFGNTNETRKVNGTLAENGVGKFADLNDAALKSIRDELHATHIWLTGVLAQATSTDYAAIGKPADDPILLKGLAGSPYAIKDYGDVCPDYAKNPTTRTAEFKALLKRIHAKKLRVIIDFVPNHVARSHALAPGTSHERVTQPTNRPGDPLSFSTHDDPTQFFAPDNHFFWLQADSPGGGAPLRLPGEDGQPGCIYEPERTYGRVTGNNSATWSPSRNDWYETAKLNYGFDFTTGRRTYPHGHQPDLPIPDTWKKMDAVLAHWQALGVDGFRCDMAHMVPPEFWCWAVDRARQRQPEVFFIAEAYNNDPMKVEGADGLVSGFRNVMIDLLNAGFDAVYDDPSYKALKNIYDGGGWANDLDGTLGVKDGVIAPDYVFQGSLRYAENHDEVRLASKGNWGGLGMEVGRAVSGVLYGLSRGPVLLYSGQEVGEPAEGSEGFSDDNGRTTIFDYWSMPELTKWVNGHRYDGARLSSQQKALREFYGRLLQLVGEPAFRDGEFFPLNSANLHNPAFGRLPGEGASGHWLYAYVRADAQSGQRFLVVANFHRNETLHGVGVQVPRRVAEVIFSSNKKRHTLSDRLGTLPPIRLTPQDVASFTLTIPAIPPLTAAYFEINAP